MKCPLKALLSESSSVSTMRLMSIAALLVGSAIALYGVYMGKDLGGVAQISGVFIGAAFSGKAIQKFAETKAE